MIDLAILILVVNAVTNGLTEPIKKQFPDINFWWFVYVPFAVGLIVVLVPVPDVVLNALAVAGGASGLYDIIDSVGKNEPPDAG